MCSGKEAPPTTPVSCSTISHFYWPRLCSYWCKHSPTGAIIDKILGNAPTRRGRIKWGEIWGGVPPSSQPGGLGERPELHQWLETPFGVLFRRLGLCRCFEFVKQCFMLHLGQGQGLGQLPLPHRRITFWHIIFEGNWESCERVEWPPTHRQLCITSIF